MLINSQTVNLDARMQNNEPQAYSALDLVIEEANEKNGLEEVGMSLIRNGANGNANSLRERQPVIEACALKLRSLAMLLIEQKVDRYVRNSIGCNALHFACLHQMSDVIELLLKGKGMSEITNALNEVLFSGPNVLLKIITDYCGIDGQLIAQDEEGNTPMHYLRWGSKTGSINSSLFKLIQVAGSDEIWQIQNHSGETPLQPAIPTS